jgi:hypothetical protein
VTETNIDKHVLMRLEWSGMDTKKTSKKPSKTAALPAPVVEQPAADSKPAKRAAAPKTKTVPAAAAKPFTAKAATPKTTTHRHSKLAVPPTVPSIAVSVAEASVPAPVSAPGIDFNQVAKLAYKFYEERAYVDGFADEDWQRAEKALAAKYSR